MGRRARIPRHDLLRTPASAGVGRPAGLPRRVAAGDDAVADLGRIGRAVEGALRRARPRPPRGRRDRCRRLPAPRPGGSDASRRGAGPRPRRRVHLGDLPLRSPRRPRGRGAHGSRVRPRRGGHRGHGSHQRLRAQSSTGEVADLAAITRRAREVGAIVVVDATQAAGWLPLDASEADFLVAAAYKWLCAPRGRRSSPSTPSRRPGTRSMRSGSPLAAGWFAGEGDAVYGMPPRLAEDARAFDISPAWHSWVGTAPALETLLAVGVETIHDHDVGLANAFPHGDRVGGVGFGDRLRRSAGGGARACGPRASGSPSWPDGRASPSTSTPPTPTSRRRWRP